jgi:cell division protein FtsL
MKRGENGMNFSPELILSVIIQLIAVGIFIGVFKTTISFMQEQIADIKTNLKEDKKELKDEMQKYNNVLSRMIIVEQAAKSAHHRIDNMEGKC